jgi:hypothetical protein
MQKILLTFVDDIYEDLELRYPKLRCEEAGYAIRLAALALHPTNPLVIYGGVEQGGVIKSIDGGKAWSLDHEHVDKDVHWIAMDRSRPDVLLAATGYGLFLSKDGALSWAKLIDDYTRSGNDPSARSDGCFCRACARGG